MTSTPKRFEKGEQEYILVGGSFSVFLDSRAFQASFLRHCVKISSLGTIGQIGINVGTNS